MRLAAGVIPPPAREMDVMTNDTCTALQRLGELANHLADTYSLASARFVTADNSNSPLARNLEELLVNAFVRDNC